MLSFLWVSRGALLILITQESGLMGPHLNIISVIPMAEGRDVYWLFPTRSDRCLFFSQVVDQVSHMGTPNFRWCGEVPSYHVPGRRTVGLHL